MMDTILFLREYHDSTMKKSHSLKNTDNVMFCSDGYIYSNNVVRILDILKYGVPHYR